MQTEVGRLAALIAKYNGSSESAEHMAAWLSAEGVTVPPAPVDPAWMDKAAWTLLDSAIRPEMTSEEARSLLRALLAAGYRVIPPTQDREAVIEKAMVKMWHAIRIDDSMGYDTVSPALDRELRTEATALYDAGMLVEGDGR